jgi:3-deoxy-7-phosphoheptulonate synthase
MPHRSGPHAQPRRLVQAYNQSASTLNLLRAFTKGGFADLGRVHAWTQEFVASAPRASATSSWRRDRPCAALHAACGVDTENNHQLHETDFYTSHEALLLGYEEALTREDSLTGDWYDCSAHMLWIGERTRQLDGAHVEFLRGVGNPIGCKVGPTTTTPRGARAVRALNPARMPGRLTLISRMGADKVEDGCARCCVPSATPGTRWCGRAIPMHGNTITSVGGRKTREFDASAPRSTASSRPTRPRAPGPAASTSSSPATTSPSALGGADKILDSQLDDRYQTVCDPRLNGRQSLDLAFPALISPFGRRGQAHR